MSSIQRYKKPGGFLQLLSLIETFAPPKRDKFLEMIESESSVWAGALREHSLSIERIFSWPDAVSIEVLKSLPTMNMAVALEGLKEDVRVRMTAYFTASELRKLQDSLNGNKPRPDEIAANVIKLVEMARKLITQGDLRPEKFDPAMVIPESYELKLEGQIHRDTHEKVSYENSSAHHHEPTLEVHGNSDVLHLQKTLAHLVKENRQLKEEARVMRDKLDQIKKIA